MAEPVSLDAFEAEPTPAVAPAPTSLSWLVCAALGDEFPRRAARFLGQDEGNTRSAIDLLVSAILRRLAHRSATPDGAVKVFAELGSAQLERDFLAATDRLRADAPAGQHEAPHPGEHAAQALFGRWTGSLVVQVGATTGLDVETVWRLLGLVTPLAMAALRDQVRERGFDAAALQERLARDHGIVRSTPRRAPGRTVLLVALLAAAIAGAVALAWRGGADPAATGAEARSAGASSTPAAPRGAALDGLTSFLASDRMQDEYVFVLDGIQFEPESATLNSASNPQLAQLAAVLGVFPEARIALEAYADNDTAEGSARAERRALAVSASLVALGIERSRIRLAGAAGPDRLGPRIEARVTKE